MVTFPDVQALNFWGIWKDTLLLHAIIFEFLEHYKFNPVNYLIMSGAL